MSVDSFWRDMPLLQTRSNLILIQGQLHVLERNPTNFKGIIYFCPQAPFPSRGLKKGLLRQLEAQKSLKAQKKISKTYVYNSKPSGLLPILVDNSIMADVVKLGIQHCQHMDYSQRKDSNIYD